MPFSILVQGSPDRNVPVRRVQGASIQGMFLELMGKVDPAVARRLHDDNKYRPYTLSPLGIGEPSKAFDGFRLPRQERLPAGTPCYLRVALLEDTLFPIFIRYFLGRPRPSFSLGDVNFEVTDMLLSEDEDTSNPWICNRSYKYLIERAERLLEPSPDDAQRKITLRFLTPTGFRRGKVNFLLPDPRLVFGSYRKRFEEFYGLDFPEDFDDQVEFHVGVSNFQRLEISRIKTQRVTLDGFTGKVTYTIGKGAPPELVSRMNLLADYASFCGTGKKTTVGMGQTIRVN